MGEEIETNIITLSKTVIPAHIENPSITHEEMVTTIGEGKLYDGFLGGVACTLLQSQKVYETITDEEGNETEITFVDKFPSYTNLSGNTVAIRICNPVNKTSWYNSTSDIFSKFVDNFIVSKFKTKSEFETLIKSSAYVEQSEDEI